MRVSGEGVTTFPTQRVSQNLYDSPGGSCLPGGATQSLAGGGSTCLRRRSPHLVLRRRLGPHHMQLESSVGTLRVFGENHRRETHQPPPPSRQRPTLFCALVAAPAETLHLVFNAFFDLRSLLSGQTALDCARELGRRLCHLLAYERILEPRAYHGERGDALTKVLARTAF
jgi:hypothetical protein